MPKNLQNEKCQNCLFKHIVCKYLSADEFDQLYSNTIQLMYKKGECILKQGSCFTHIVYLSAGTVKVNHSDDAGRELIFTVVKSPNMLGGAYLFNEERNMFSITALEDCEVCLIDLRTLKDFALKNNAFALRLLDFVSSMFKDSIYNFISLAHKQVNGRIADILIYLSRKVYKSGKFTLTLSRKEIADFAGCSHENVIHTLTRLEKDGVIRTDKKLIEILDMKRLEMISRNG